jgi:hypothetical protein
MSAPVASRRRCVCWLRVATRLVVCLLAALVFAASADAETKPPVLISEPDSTRAVALESVTFTREPFSPTSPLLWVPDHRTRVMLFALNLTLAPGGDFSNVTADAEDGAHRRYDLKVEYAAPVPGQVWMTEIVVVLDEEMGDAGDVLVRVVNQGASSNRVRVGIGHVGDGLADDADSQPTPVPSYLIRGRVSADGAALAGATLALGGDGFALATSDADGNYSIYVPAVGNFALSASKAFYDFNSGSRALVNLSSPLDGIDFAATRQKRVVQGRVFDDMGRAMPKVSITLARDDGSASRTMTTDDAGSFAFTDVPAGFAYTVAPDGNNILAFTTQSINPLTDATTLVFNAARRTYTISGRVADSSGAGIAAVTVALNDSDAGATTDADGKYAFAGVTAGYDYTVAVSKADYVFAPQTVALAQLDGDRRANFGATIHVVFGGRVIDKDGSGVYGIRVSASGAETDATTTGTDGSYSIAVSQFGDYALKPSKEQDYYAFAPAVANLNTQSGSRNADFNATLNLSASPSYVLEFDGLPKSVDYSMPIISGSHIDYNLFWTDEVVFGHFFWEFWAMPGENAGGTYMISDGYGGAHALLFGFSNFGAREPNRYQLLGNIWNGHELTYFASDQGPAPHEWAHFSVGWDGKYIVTYFDGVPVGKTVFVGPRITPGGIQGCGRMLVGGSDHSNFIGRIAQLRGYEDNNPREDAHATYASFAPQTVFDVDGQMLTYYFRPSENIADLSLYGYLGRQHPGLVRSTANGVMYPCNGCPLPQFVVDPTAPDFAHPERAGQVTAPVATPSGVPNGALVFDSFSRRNSTYILGGAGGLGSTEGGTAGARAWRTNEDPARPQPFGILNGIGVLLANSTSVAWVSPAQGTTDLDVRIDRRAGAWGSGHDTGLSFRVADAADYFFAYSTEAADTSQTLNVGYYQAGQRTDLATNVSMPAGWTTLRAVTNAAGVVRVYADNTLLYSTTINLLSDSDGAGLYNNGAGLGLTNRWDNFTIFKAQP